MGKTRWEYRKASERRYYEKTKDRYKEQRHASARAFLDNMAQDERRAYWRYWNNHVAQPEKQLDRILYDPTVVYKPHGGTAWYKWKAQQREQEGS